MGYLDSGYIVKFYVDEPDSPAVRRLAEALGEVRCASLGRAEVSTALHRKLREGIFREAAFREVLAQFEHDCADGLWTWFPVTSGVLAVTVAARALGFRLARERTRALHRKRFAVQPRDRAGWHRRPPQERARSSSRS